ncbi:MAG TPA: UDP-N-acetylmuramoyl-L-alanyl-D-glutamate--2,6-diaminopimelate ligase [Rhabdochlamydiaceae bacterium]|jgi:UDP-N-acetylmuramoyl-L-alanyl-D-glutamate--2,6-diaminopimelate ligase
MEPIKLKKLLKEIPGIVVKGSREIEITGICAHSKRIAPGNLFIAKKGITYDGARFIGDAIASGASAIVTDIYDPFFPHVVQILTDNIPQVEAALAQEYYQHASSRLCLVGITGTNGKTTTAYLIKHLFDHRGFPCGLIGTIEWIAGQHIFPSTLTTSDIITNHKLFYEMLLQEQKGCVMEVSSHALEQQRVRNIEFDIAIFTNLTQDHLDYHGSMEAYAAAKSKLFSSLKPGKKSCEKVAIVNRDSPYAQQMIAECSASVFTYGIDGPCDLQASDISFSAQGTQCAIRYQNRSFCCSSRLIGRFNVYNVLAALAAGIVRRYPLEEMLESAATFLPVQGRLEPVENAKGLSIFVDYAHTDNALSNAIATLREIGKKRIITVFGCGGNRDPAKRPKMGFVAESLSDVAIITSDNPRSEDPLEIIAEILTGLRHPQSARVIPDREEAIRTAIDLCTKDDILLIAGKGHETYQIFSHGTISFDDRAIAQKACR